MICEIKVCVETIGKRPYESSLFISSIRLEVKRKDLLIIQAPVFNKHLQKVAWFCEGREFLVHAVIAGQACMHVNEMA